MLWYSSLLVIGENNKLHSRCYLVMLVFRERFYRRISFWIWAWRDQPVLNSLYKIFTVKTYIIYDIYRYDAVLLEGTKLLYKIWPRKYFFASDELHIILKGRNLEICKHSSFFNYWRNCLLNKTWSSEI